MHEEASRTSAAGGSLTKTDLVQEVSRVLEIPLAEGLAVVEQIFSSMVRALQAGDRIEIRGFGSFNTRSRKARIGRNPKTGAKVAVPPKRVVFFKPSKEVRQLVNSSIVQPNKFARDRPQ